MTDAAMRAAVADVLAANGLGTARLADGDAEPADPPVGRLRITVTGGIGPPGSDRGDAAPTLLITAGPAAPPATAKDPARASRMRRSKRKSMTSALR